MKYLKIIFCVLFFSTSCASDDYAPCLVQNPEGRFVLGNELQDVMWIYGQPAVVDSFVDGSGRTIKVLGSGVMGSEVLTIDGVEQDFSQMVSSEDFYDLQAFKAYHCLCSVDTLFDFVPTDWRHPHEVVIRDRQYYPDIELRYDGSGSRTFSFCARQVMCDKQLPDSTILKNQPVRPCLERFRRNDFVYLRVMPSGEIHKIYPGRGSAGIVKIFNPQPAK